MTKRLDVEGMRAIAVLLVVIFHINPKLIPGGFVGVDMFFVISGFVITQSLAKGGLNSYQDFAEFYRRRIRRIFPATFFVTSVTLLVGIFILTPADLYNLSWSAIASTLSASNIYFTYFLDISYFSKSSDTVPLLHLWSLGVEEQFYLLWPLFLYFFLPRKKLLLFSVFLLIGISVLVGEFFIGIGNASFAYYMLPPRAFQLALGGTCFFLAPIVESSIRGKKSLVVSVIGLGLITASAAFLTGQSPFPGFNAVPVTVGTGLLILGGLNRQVISDLLSLRLAQWIGGLSFALYLWHWPLLAFARYASIDLNITTSILLFGSMIALAQLTKTYIEDRTRHSELPLRRIAFHYFVIPFTATAVVAGSLIASSGYGPYKFSTTYASALRDAEKSGTLLTNTKYVCHRDTLTLAETAKPSCIINSTSEPRILLWGDSHSAHHVGLLSEIAKAQGFSFRNISHSACPPLLNSASAFANPRYQASCALSVSFVKQILDNYDTVILAASWNTYAGRKGFIDEVQRTILDLTKQGKKVIIVGHMPYFPRYDRDCGARSLKIGTDCAQLFKTSKDGAAWNFVDATNATLSEFAEKQTNVKYFDFTNLICSKAECSPYINGFGYYFDEGHLNVQGSHLLGKMAAGMKKYQDFTGFPVTSTDLTAR